VPDNIATIVVLDTETTDLDPDLGAEICEIGFVTLNREADDDSWSFGQGVTVFVETNAPFSPVARAAHHIDPAQCRPGAPNCIPRNVLIESMKELEKPGQMLYAAHNAPFDFKFLPELSLAVIDTYKIAKHIWPDAPKFGNQVLRYYLGVEPPEQFLEGLGAHRALYDAACTAAVLREALKEHSPEELVRLTKTPILQAKCTFGKHKDKAWSEVPTDYLQWMVRANDMYQNDEDIRFTVDHYIKQRISTYI
jgi:exodeoxyribonuclease X